MKLHRNARLRPKPAEAAASNDCVALERMIIEQLPLLVNNAARSEGQRDRAQRVRRLSQIAAGLVSQALAIYSEARHGRREKRQRDGQRLLRQRSGRAARGGGIGRTRTPPAPSPSSVDEPQPGGASL
jgi:hypothetical protein